MNPRSLTHVDALYEIYCAARELPSEQRAAYVAAQELDARDRALLEEFLRQEEKSSQAAALLDAALPGEPEPLAPGTALGIYRIEAFIGSGGQGSVYRAALAADVVDKKVAIKLPHRLSGESLRAIQREAQALARLEHAGIARFISMDRSAAGDWFLVTEYVEGRRLDQALAGAGAAPVLALFITLCDALGQAHRLGVAHLDLKPSNILVTAAGEPRILDFGLGTVLSPRGGNEPARGYTRPYAAPEQLAGQASTACDTYALGVLLLQTLTHCPFEALEARIAQLQPGSAQAAALQRQLGADLYAILQRACAPDSAQRYASIAQFGADLRAVRAAEPVSARAWTWRYALYCLARRRPLATAASLAAVMLMAAALTALAVQRGSLLRAEGEARREAERARVGLDLVVSAMESADPETAPEVTAAEKALVERLRRAAAQAQDPQVRLAVDLVVARIARSTGNQRAALQLTDDVVLRAQAQTAPSLLVDALVAKLETHIELAEFDQADAALARLASLPQSPVQHSAVLHAAGRRQMRAGRLDEGEASLRAALAGATSNYVRLAIGNDLGTILNDRGRYAEAAALYDEQRPLLETVYGAESVGAGVNAHNRALSHFGLADSAAALTAIREAQRLYTARLGAGSARNADALSMEATIVLDDDPARAQDCLQQAVAIYRRIYGPDNPRISQAKYVLGQLHLNGGDAAAALREFDEALVLAAALGEAHPFVGALKLGKGAALVASNQPEAALPLLQAALSLFEAMNAAPDNTKAQVYTEQSHAYRLLGRAELSEAASATAYAMIRDTLPADSLELAHFRMERAASLALAGRRVEANEHLAAARNAFQAQAARPAAQRLRPRLEAIEAYVQAQSRSAGGGH